MGSQRQILDAAAQLFFERGFDAVGVDEIGRSAGVSGSAIYRHFTSKDEILAALLDEATDELLVLLPATDDNPHAELSGLVRAHVQFAARHRRLVAIWATEQRALAEPYRRANKRRQHV
jgi:AcrR family transcriptional regulator